MPTGSNTHAHVSLQGRTAASAQLRESFMQSARNLLHKALWLEMEEVVEVSMCVSVVLLVSQLTAELLV